MSLMSKLNSLGPQLASKIQHLPFGKVAHLGLLVTGGIVVGKRVMQFVREDILSGQDKAPKTVHDPHAGHRHGRK